MDVEEEAELDMVSTIFIQANLEHSIADLDFSLGQ
jgi:hypothetical protein